MEMFICDEYVICCLTFCFLIFEMVKQEHIKRFSVTWLPIVSLIARKQNTMANLQ